MTYPPNPPDGNDNPYGGPPPPGQEPNPYGNAPYNAYGGQPAYQGPGGEQPKYDGISIAALVLGLTCCLSFVGAILGFFGLSRTRDGRRRGRWAAVVGIVAGLVGTAALVAGIVVGVWFFNNSIRPDNAEVGQCVDIDTDDDGAVGMWKKDCTESHDGEIVGVAEVNESNREAIETGMLDYCPELLDAEDRSVIEQRDDIRLDAVIEDPDDVEIGDHLVCYVEAARGTLDEKVLD